MRRQDFALAVFVLLGRSASAAPEPLAPAVLSPGAAAETVLLPGAANTIGTHATRWRSDLTLRNPGADPIEVRVLFLRAGTPTAELGSVPHKDYFLLAGESRELRNVLGAELGVSGTGALLVSASRSLFPNNPALSAVSASLRTAKPILLGPGDVGTTIGAAEVTDASRQIVAGLRHDGVGEKGLRGAVGAVNLSRSAGLTLRVEYLDEALEPLGSQEISMGPLSPAQQPVPFRLGAGATARFVKTDGPGPFVAYATTVDNATGEPSFLYAAPEAGRSAGAPLVFSALAEKP